MLSKAINVAGIALFIGLISASTNANAANSFYNYDPSLGALQSITITSTLEEQLTLANSDLAADAIQSGTLDYSDDIYAYLALDGHYNHETEFAVTIATAYVNSGILSYDLAPGSDETFDFSQTFVRTLTSADFLPGMPPLTSGNGEEIFADIAAGQAFNFESSDAGGEATVNPISGGFPYPFRAQTQARNGFTNTFFGISQGGIGVPVLTYTYLSAAPEPSVWSLMILGLGLCGAALRRRRGVLKGIGNPAGSSSR